jgi:hypothetical protein
MKQPILALCLVAAAAAAASADEITLANGKKLVGIRRIDPQQPGKVIVEVGTGTITLDASQVSSVTPGNTNLHEYESKWAAVKDSKKAADFWGLAQWCKQNKVSRHLEMLCRKTVALDAEHEGAHKMLGHEKVDGKWLDFDAAQARKGLIKLGDGSWVTKAQKELMEKKALEAKERQLAAQREREERKAEEARLRQQAVDDANAWYARQMAQLDGYFYSPSFAFTTPYFRPYWFAPYQRSRGYYQDGWKYGSGGGVGTYDLFRFIPDPFLKK